MSLGRGANVPQTWVITLIAHGGGNLHLPNPPWISKQDQVVFFANLEIAPELDSLSFSRKRQHFGDVSQDYAQTKWNFFDVKPS